MDTSRPTKTAADYLVIAISPVLIMVMVHSFCFFLVEVFYRGEAIGGVRWVLFWFVLAVVLIALIGIEQGDGQAMIYGIFLAAATWIYLSMVQPNAIFGAVLLGLVWFTAHKLTSNCTLIDDDADASGQGLLQSLRRLPSLFKNKKAQPPATADIPATPAPSPGGVAVRLPGFGPKKQSAPPAGQPSAASVSPKKKTKPQTPGVWLIYFSLAAVPIFGLGQMLLPTGDLVARHRAFVYLFLYLAAALGLLVTTSFLGLRRYLRQRYVAMPGNIARGWIQTGAVAAVVVLCLALLLPRPGVQAAWLTLRYHIDHQLRHASDFALRFNPHGTGTGRAGNQNSPNAQPDDKSGPGSDSNSKDNGNTKGQDGNKSGGGSGEGQGGNRPHDNGQGQAGDQGANGQQPPKTAPPPPPPDQNQNDKGPSGVSAKPSANSPPASDSIFSLLRILFWLAAAIGLAWVIYRYRAMILAMLQSILAAIRNFITMLLGLFRSSPAAGPVAMKKSGPAAFKTFNNPFLSGGAQLWSPDKLITYSYDALQSWALEPEAERGSPQTPREFCRQLGEEIPEAADALEHLAFLYGHVAYGASIPGSYNPEHLRLLWDYMASPRARRPSEPVPENELAGTV